MALLDARGQWGTFVEFQIDIYSFIYFSFYWVIFGLQRIGIWTQSTAQNNIWSWNLLLNLRQFFFLRFLSYIFMLTFANKWRSLRRFILKKTNQILLWQSIVFTLGQLIYQKKCSSFRKRLTNTTLGRNSKRVSLNKQRIWEIHVSPPLCRVYLLLFVVFIVMPLLMLSTLII